ncbi:MAG: hypothetical protein IMZ44_23330, partial [Planctomycetes bacterium]|nr:hypothetical protein [Planctomycetota bacterium]
MNRKSRILSVWMLLTAVCLLCPPVVARAQTIVQSFDGDSGPLLVACESGTTHCGRQPEMNVAVNGKQVVQVTWQTVGVYDYRGTLLHSTPLATFIRNAGLDPMPPSEKGPSKGPYEPHVVYDEFIGRWIITVTGHSDCLLVSASADALGPWGGVYPSCLEGGPCLDKDPGIKVGYDRNGVYYCGGHMGDENAATVPGVAYDCFAVPSAEVTAIA